MANYLSEAVTVRLAPESVAGVHPTSGWAQLQVDAGGVTGWRRTLQTVEREIHTVNATDEKGDLVAYTVEPALTHDINKDLADLIAAPSWRCNAAHFGGTGLSLFRPSAVTSTGYTVAASGDLANGLLVYARGFTTAANNGLKLTAGTSTSTEIKFATASAEASPPGNATVDVVGFQGATGDLELDASGDLVSTSLDFTTLGLSVGAWLYLPSAAEALDMGSAAYGFATAAYFGHARITAIAANKISLERRDWTPGAADDGDGKTIRVFASSRFFRNYAIDLSSYVEHSLSGEKADIKPGVSADTRYTYVHGCGVNTLEIAAPINSKITATVNLVGTSATAPLAPANRKTGPSAAYEPLATALVDTQNDLRRVRLTDGADALIAEINSWTFSLNNNITPRSVQGSFGPAGLTYGKFQYSVSMEAYFIDSDAINAAEENRDGLAWDAFVRNHQYGFVLDMPNVAIRNPDLRYAANQPVMLSCEVPAFRSETDNISGSLSVFGWLPTVAQ
jgi:hypothetical protein